MIPRIHSAASATASAVYRSCAYVGHKLADLFGRIQSIVKRIFGRNVEPQNPSEDVFRRHYAQAAPTPAKKVDAARTTTLPKRAPTPPPATPLPPKPAAAPVKLKELKVPGDGNCLFHSLLMHLNRNREKIEKANPDMKKVKTHQDLRALAVEGMKLYENNEALAIYLGDAVDNHNKKQEQWRNENVSNLNVALREKEITQTAYDQQVAEANSKLAEGKLKDVDDYIEKASKEFFFAGDAEIYVLTSRMRVQVVIKGLESQPIGQDGAGCGPLMLNLQNGDHFNPII